MAHINVPLLEDIPNPIIDLDIEMDNTAAEPEPFSLFARDDEPEITDLTGDEEKEDTTTEAANTNNNRKRGIEELDESNDVEQPPAKKRKVDENVATLAALAQDSEISDATFFVENKEYHGLKAIFAVKSRKFRDLLYNNNGTNVFSIPNISACGFEYIRDWCYELSPELTFDNVVDVLHAAKEYELSSIQDNCVTFLSSISNADDFLTVLAKFGAKESLPQEAKIILDNSEDLLQSGGDLINNDKFINLPTSLISTIIENDHLNIDEEELFGVLQSHAALAELKPLIRFGLMSSEFIFGTVKQTGILNASELVAIYEFKLGLHNHCGFRTDERIVKKAKPTPKRGGRKAASKKKGSAKKTTSKKKAPARRSSRRKR